MPIAMICGACEAKLTAPDAAAGKKVKCPKCAVLLEIPRPEPEASSTGEDFEFVEEPAPKPAAARPKPAAAPAKPKPRPVLLESDDEDEDDPSLAKTKLKPILLVKDEDDDDAPPVKKPKTKSKAALVLDDEDEEDDRPRPKKKKGKGKAKKSSSNNLVILLAGGGVALVVVGVMVWYFAIHKPNSQTELANNSNNPNLTPPHIPGQPNIPGGSKPPSAPKPASGSWENYSDANFDIWAPRGVTPAKKSTQTPAGASETVSWTNPALLRYSVDTLKLPPQAIREFEANPVIVYEQAISGMKRQLPPEMKITPAVTTFNDNKEGRQVDGTKTEKNMTVGVRARIIVGNGKLYVLTCAPVNFTLEEDKQIQAFFDNFIPK